MSSTSISCIFPVRDVNKRRKVAPQIQQRVQPVVRVPISWYRHQGCPRAGVDLYESVSAFSAAISFINISMRVLNSGAPPKDGCLT